MTRLTDQAPAEADDAVLLSRIERALGRIEGAVQALPADPVAAHADLAARHAGLRAAVAVAVGQIDGLIEARDGVDPESGAWMALPLLFGACDPVVESGDPA